MVVPRNATVFSCSWCGATLHAQEGVPLHYLEEIPRFSNDGARELALAWLAAQGDDVVSIPGTKRRRYLEENVAALDVELTDADLARLDELLPIGAASGDRYYDMSHLDR